jgi:hypothetical protein
MGRFFYLTLVVTGFFSCTDSEEFDIPINEITGQYSYESASSYFGSGGEVEREIESIGSLEVNHVQNLIYMLPLAGWHYEVKITGVQNHTLTNGVIATTFSVLLQDELIASKVFKFQGTGGTVLWDSDGTVLGVYDGVLYGDDSLRFKIKSFDAVSFEQTDTEVFGLKR